MLTDRYERVGGVNRAGLGFKVLLSAAAALSIWLATVAPVGAVTIDRQTRTVTAARLSMAFSTVGPDVVRSVQWTNSANLQGTNLVENSGPGSCASKSLEDPANFWGESYGAGGQGDDPKLVFDGSSGTWTTPASNQVQTSTEYPTSCSTYKAAVPVLTTYTYYDEAPAANEIMVQRTWRFDLAMNPPLLGSTALRAYVPQLPLAKYGQVLYPSGGILQAIEASQCSATACLKSFSDGWFAINDATVGDQNLGAGVVVLRDASDTASAQLAIQGLKKTGPAHPEPVSNATSMALQIPGGTLTGALSETEYLCFYDATSWPLRQREALQLPAGCGPVAPPAQQGAGPTVVPPSSTTPPGNTTGPSPPPSVPPPVLGHSFNVARARGAVHVEPPGKHTFTPLTQAIELPLGSIIDATHGSVSITTATAHGGTQTGQFFAGKFVLTQTRDGAVVATLTGGDFSVCPTARERRHLAHASSGHASGKHVVRKLWANAHGKFSTKGNYAAGAVQGTEWLTEDLCEGTLIRVTRDRVAVTNLVNHRHLTVKVGHKYLAKAP